MAAIAIPQAEIDRFCRKWRIGELALFGSVVGEAFRPDSDVDVLVRFDPAAEWSLYDWVDMRTELERLFGRPVDLVAESGLRNPIRRRSILRSKQVIYAA